MDRAGKQAGQDRQGWQGNQAGLGRSAETSAELRTFRPFRILESVAPQSNGIVQGSGPPDPIKIGIRPPGVADLLSPKLRPIF